MCKNTAHILHIFVQGMLGLVFHMFFVPWISTVFFPVGDLSASWSKVIISPPAFRIRARALSVTRRAHTYRKNNRHHVIGNTSNMLVLCHQVCNNIHCAMWKHILNKALKMQMLLCQVPQLFLTWRSHNYNQMKITNCHSCFCNYGDTITHS